MIPQLIDYNQFFKKKEPIPIKPPSPKPIPIQQTDPTYFLFNIGCLIIIILGILFLMFRKENKQENKKNYNEKINDLYKKMN